MDAITDADRRHRPSGKAPSALTAAPTAAAPTAAATLADMTMAGLMWDRPASVPVLLRRGLACSGCAMAPFMTVREAAEAHGMDVDALLDVLSPLDGTPGGTGR